MTDESDRPKSPLGYAVGHRRPPAATRFKPGQSGNPKGRPKGAKGPGQILSKLLATKVKVQDQGRERSMTAIEVILKNVVNGAMRNEPRSVKTLLSLIREHCQADTGNTPIASTAGMSDADAEILKAFLGKHEDVTERSDEDPAEGDS